MIFPEPRDHDAARVNGIHAHALVAPGATLAAGVTVGPGTIIADDVVIGENTWIGAHVIIDDGTRIGSGNRIYHGAIIGTEPQHMGHNGAHTSVRIGDNNVLREYCSINRGTGEHGATTVGDACYLMIYSHLGHDCRVGNGVILANASNVAGHVHIDDYANISGLVPIHQFVRIGKYAFISGGTRVLKDVPPYIIVAAHPIGFSGLNTVGLARHGFSKEQIQVIKQAYRCVYQSQLNRTQAVERIRETLPQTPEVQEILDFITGSERGIM